MRRCNHLVIFARAPVLGRVKTRLAADIGPLAALRFHRATTARLLRRLGGDRRWRCWLALTPDRAARGTRFWPGSATRLPQGGGDLGRRMARPFRCLPPGRVVIVGSDIPEISPRHIAFAFRLLGRCDLVLGPAGDGGYWLLGARRRPLPHGVLCGVRLSTEHALDDTLARIPGRMSIGFAATLSDVDDGAAYRRWRARLTPSSDAPAGAA
jgi:rSAM/selenodomain-associated transferase 1